MRKIISVTILIFTLLNFVAGVSAICEAESNNESTVQETESSEDRMPSGIHSTLIEGTTTLTEETITEETKSVGVTVDKTATEETTISEEVSNSVSIDYNEVEQLPYETETVIMASIIYREAGSACVEEKACVAWCILNRVDAGYGDLYSVMIAPNQFSYFWDDVYSEECYRIAEDVINRWLSEKQGYNNVGRVLPQSMLFFEGDGFHNWFHSEFYSQDYYCWGISYNSLESPY